MKNFIFFLQFLSLLSCKAFKHIDEPKPDLILKIYPYKMICQGEDLQWCYLIKSNNKETEYFYSDIIGLDYEWGYEYEIAMNQSYLGDVPSGGSNFQYKLKEILYKKPIAKGYKFEVAKDISSIIQVNNNEMNILDVNFPISTNVNKEQILNSKLFTFEFDGNKFFLASIK